MATLQAQGRENELRDHVFVDQQQLDELKGDCATMRDELEECRAELAAHAVALQVHCHRTNLLINLVLAWNKLVSLV